MRLSKKLYKLKYYLRKTWKEELRKADIFNNVCQTELDEVMEVRFHNRKEQAKSIEDAKKEHRAEMAEMRKEHGEQVENAYRKHDDIYEDLNLEGWTSPEKFKRVSAQMEINRKLHAEMLQLLQEEKNNAEEELRKNNEIIKGLEMNRKSQQSELGENEITIEAEAQLAEIAADEATLIQDKCEYLLQQIDESDTVDEEIELKKQLARLNFSDEQLQVLSEW